MGIPCALAANCAFFAVMPSSKRTLAAGLLLEPTSSEVLAAVKSLCAEQLKPFGRLVLKRIRERAAAAQACGVDDVPLIDPKQLRKICEQCKDLRVVPDEGKEYAALLVGRNLLFVDPTSPTDRYSPQLWVDFARYVLSDECGLLPASRYDAASVLRSRELAFLEGHSLGQLCHIVQLAISHKSILGHKDGHLVPYHASLQHAKEVCAIKQEMFSNISSKAYGVVTCMEECQMMLKQLLFEVRGPIVVSSLKRLFQERFNRDLCETVLGHKRLFELLQDPRMQGISLHGHQNGQLAICLAEPVCMAPVPYLVPVLACQAPMGFSTIQQSNVSNVCLSTSPMARSSVAINIRLPELRGVDLDDCVSPLSTPRRSHSSDVESQEERPLEFCLGKDSEEQIDDLSSVGTVVKNTFLEFAEDNASSCEGSARRRTQSEPRRMRV